MRPTDVVSLFAPPLAACGVEWMVAGGVAAILYGEPRLTQDIDVVVALQARDALVGEAGELGVSAQWQEMMELNE